MLVYAYVYVSGRLRAVQVGGDVAARVMNVLSIINGQRRARRRRRLAAHVRRDRRSGARWLEAERPSRSSRAFSAARHLCLQCDTCLRAPLIDLHV